MLKYNALYFTYPPPPRKNTISAIFTVLFCFFIADSRKYHQILTLLNSRRWLKDNSTKFRRLLKQCNVFCLQLCLLGLLARIPAITKPRGFSAQGVAPLDIRCDTVVCSFCSTPWRSNTKFFPLESRINFTRPPPRFLTQL